MKEKKTFGELKVGDTVWRENYNDWQLEPIRVIKVEENPVNFGYIRIYLSSGSNFVTLVRNYHYDSYSNKRELTVQAMENIFIADYKSTDGQLCFIDNDCKHHKSEDINKSSCTMLYLMGDGDE